MQRCFAFVAIVLLAPLVAHANTLTVNSSADSGGICPGPTCTLRQAIATAGSGDTIDFNPSLTTIDLTTDELLIDKNLTISGPGAASLKIRKASPNDGSPTFRILHIPAGNFTVAISAVTIAEGVTNGIGALPAGGGMFIERGNTVAITSCTLSGNRAGQNGGGIYNLATLTITNSTISGNVAGFQVPGGGGIYNAGDMTITKSTISGNTAQHANGGGINNAGTALITDSTISGNYLGVGNGAGILNSGTMGLRSATITNNFVTYYGSSGGGIYNDLGTLNAKNTIIAGNNTYASGKPDLAGELHSQGYNLIGSNEGATIIPAQATDQVGTAASPLDPVLGPLHDNGGPTFTHAVLSGSPALDKGDSSGFATDQRGFSRPRDNLSVPNAAGGDGSDIGSFERQEVSIARALNLSTRSQVLTGKEVMIGGFIITGNVPKPVVLRALGPSLVGAGVPASAVLNDPVLELRGASGALIASNDNWKESPQRSEIEGSRFAPSDDREAVIWSTLPPAAYTAIVTGKDAGTGIGVVEIYDLDQSSDSTLANISSRAFVETGSNVLIGGFTLGANNGSAQIVVRAIGPSLVNSGFDGFDNRLIDPTLELRDANGELLVFNDDWKDDATQASYIAAVRLQPPDDAEAAVTALLPPGAYTAIVAGKTGGKGVAVVEIYNLQ